MRQIHHPSVPTAPPVDTVRIREAVDEVLRDFLIGKTPESGDPDLVRVVGLLDEFLAGGKRLRPLYCVLGWYAGRGQGCPGPVHGVAAALELFHAFALIHDDIMDDSALRRGRPTMHRALGADAPAAMTQRDRRRFGVNSAMLMGDLAMVWSDELLMTSLAGHSRFTSVLPLVGGMRTELMMGQHRDLLATGSAGSTGADLESMLETIRGKTTSYTVENPLLLGATLAGASDHVINACRAYALPIGEAFQLRDDLLGVFGDPHLTGKPAIDDLRSGKATPLLALALRAADPAQRRLLCARVGDPGLDAPGADDVRRVLRDTGAVAAVEWMIADRRDAALAALADPALPPGPRRALADLALAATDRTA